MSYLSRFWVPEKAIETMLTAIEEMKYFLRIAYGDSKEYVGSTIEVKFQGLCQGNGADPEGWAHKTVPKQSVSTIF